MPETLIVKARIALVGELSVGKTSLILRFLEDQHREEYFHTIGTKVSKINLTIPYQSNIEVQMEMTIFDIIGQRGFGDMIKETFFHECKGLLAVCDITRKETLFSLHDWITTAVSIAGETPRYILVNKADQREKSAFSEEEVAKIAEIYDCPYIYTSAKTGENVDNAFNLLALEIVEQAMKARKLEEEEKGLREKILYLLVRRGNLGADKREFFETFKGISYEELEKVLTRLERDGLVKINWKGAADFHALITMQGESSVKSAMIG